MPKTVWFIVTFYNNGLERFREEHGIFHSYTDAIEIANRLYSSKSIPNEVKETVIV